MRYLLSSILVSYVTLVSAVTQLPNTAGIDGELTAKLGVDHFFSLWIVFNNDDVAMSGKTF
ncbi:hypothetical protein O3M35_005085 [Rhynocoris fuscipes]|uniref:Uncharacterized protein n=1 Tax=Rhynocoris fuscipes TaxID=488301 RepID=A0AAW1DIB7_9HEMI